jgi:hypothetical protein
MNQIDIRNIFVVEILIDNDIIQIIHLLGNNGKEPTNQEISNVVLQRIRKSVHQGSTFEVNDIYSVEVALLESEQIKSRNSINIHERANE